MLSQPERKEAMVAASGSKRCRQMHPLSLPSRCSDTDVTFNLYSSILSRAIASTASNISAVNRPVFVFWRLT